MDNENKRLKSDVSNKIHKYFYLPNVLTVEIKLNLVLLCFILILLPAHIVFIDYVQD